MESKGSEPGLDSKEPSFSSYCSNTLAESAARVSMEESSEQHHLDYNFEFCSLLEFDDNVFPVFNGAALDKHDKQVESITNDIVSPPSLVAKNPEGVCKKSNSIGSSSRRWSLTRLLPRNNSELEAPTRTNNNTEEEEKEAEQFGCDRFIDYMCPPILPANPKATHPDEVDGEKLVEMETKISSKSSSTDSDGSNKRVFPLPESVPLDKSQHERGILSPSNVDKFEGLKYKKSKSIGTLSKGWSFKGLLRRSSSERGTLRSTKNTEDGMENTSVFSRCFSLPSRPSFMVSTNLEEGENTENYNKRKSTGTFSTRWSFKGFLRRSSSERGTPRSSNNNEEGMENNSVFSRCFSLPSRSSSKVSTNLEEGEKLGSDGCMFYLCPIISLPPAGCTQTPKVADQRKVAVKEKKPSSKCSTDSDLESKTNNSADLNKVDGYSKQSKLKNNPHKMYLKEKTGQSPYMHEAIGFFAMIRPLAMFYTTSASV